MNLSVDSKKIRASKVKQEAADRGPTPETRSKAVEDQAVRLHGSGIIDQRQFTAALEIRDVQDSLWRLHYRNREPGKIQGGTTIFHPLDGLSPEMKRAFDLNYRPWRYWADTQRYQGMTYNQITTAVITDSVPPAQQVLHVVVASLEKYADFMEGN